MSLLELAAVTGLDLQEEISELRTGVESDPELRKCLNVFSIAEMQRALVSGLSTQMELTIKGSEMKAKRELFVCMAVVGLLVAAQGSMGAESPSDDCKAELAKLKGVWISELDGRTHIIKFDGEKFATIFDFREGTTSTSGTITIDTSKTPKQMDWKFAEGIGRGEKLKGTTALTIYHLEGDSFKFCAGRQKERREDFPDKESVDEYIYLVFKRAK